MICKWFTFQAFVPPCVLFWPVSIPKGVCSGLGCSDLARGVNLFTLERMLFITARHIHVSTGFEPQITLSAPSSSNTCCFHTFSEQLACFGCVYPGVVLTTPSFSGKATKSCLCHQIAKERVKMKSFEGKKLSLGKNNLPKDAFSV